MAKYDTNVPADQAGLGTPVPPGTPLPNLTAYGAGLGGGSSTLDLTVSEKAKYVTIFNNNSQTNPIQVTMRNGNSTTVYLGSSAGICLPTAAVGKITSNTPNMAWIYTDEQICIPATNSGAGVWTGSGNAPFSGIWRFTATLSVASTPLTVGGTALLPKGTTASIASTTTMQDYEMPVVGGTAYAVAGGTVVSGWIGSA